MPRTLTSGNQRRNALVALAGVLCACAAVAALHRPARLDHVSVFDQASIAFDEHLEEGARSGRYRRLLRGQSLQRTITLPTLPADQADARRIIARVQVTPVITTTDGRRQPGDPWTRMGSVNLVIGDPNARFSGDADWEDRDLETYPAAEEIELIRFITGFGGPVEFDMDLTSLAPLLSGEQTLRMYVSTYADPGWHASLSLHYLDENVGPRRPVFAQRVFNDQNVNSDDNVVRATIEIPEGLAMPRLRLITTGHATDGTAGDEFLPRVHILRVDGREVARFRPWSEEGSDLRSRNPTSGRIEVDGRSLWSSDLDRTGWHPGLPVEPMVLPLPELTAGRHEIELEIVGIRPVEGEKAARGYWRVSGIVVGDEPWPSGG